MGDWPQAPLTNAERRGVVMDGVTNNYTILQAMLDEGLVIELPKGTCLTSSLIMSTGSGVKGQGIYSTVLKGLAASTTPVLKNSTHARACNVSDMTIDGGGASSTTQGGLLFDNSAALDTDVTNGIAPYVDARHHAHNLLIQYCGGDGLKQLGRGACIFGHIQVWNCNGHGVVADTDCEYYGIDVGASGLDGFLMKSGGSNRFVCCKAWYSGRVSTTGAGITNGTGHGWHVENGTYSPNTFSSCDAQDNARAGFYLNNAGRQTFQSCDADSNNTANLGHANIEFISASRSTFTGLSWDRSANTTKALAALRVTGGGACLVDIIVDGDAVMGQGVLTADTESNTTLNYHRIRIDAGDDPNVAYALSVTLPRFREDVRVAALTGAITINPPTERYKGQRMMVTLLQDATGGRLVTWAAGFSVGGWKPRLDPNAVSEISFTFDGTNWIAQDDSPPVLTGSVAWDPANLTTGSSEGIAVTVTGARVGDPLLASLTTLPATKWLITGHVTANDTAFVVIKNETGGTVNLAAGTLNVVVFKR